jgi:hypothetical protein
MHYWSNAWCNRITPFLRESENIQGTVEIGVVIGMDGEVTDVAAQEPIQRWLKLPRKMLGCGLGAVSAQIRIPSLSRILLRL